MPVRKRMYFVVDRGHRLPGGSITWRVEVEASDWFYATEVCGMLARKGFAFRRREIATRRAIPVTPAEADWHAERLRQRNAYVAARTHPQPPKD